MPFAFTAKALYTKPEELYSRNFLHQKHFGTTNTFGIAPCPLLCCCFWLRVRKGDANELTLRPKKCEEKNGDLQKKCSICCLLKCFLSIRGPGSILLLSHMSKLDLKRCFCFSTLHITQQRPDIVPRDNGTTPSHPVWQSAVTPNHGAPTFHQPFHHGMPKSWHPAMPLGPLRHGMPPRSLNMSPKHPVMAPQCGSTTSSGDTTGYKVFFFS